MWCNCENLGEQSGELWDQVGNTLKNMGNMMGTPKSKKNRTPLFPL